MAFEGLITRLNMMFNEMENQPEDAHELLEQIHMELSRLKATGQPLPQDLLDFEARLNAEFEKRGISPGAARQ
ncbi:hypothetical protein [Oricola thermophila]|uniref:Uncharacterized protein n=1 Tax=Oricola thermophila TaxID=2742145 RepID=A0A6N1VDA5_9HYPH|nr:hypothetical protein [Oricola thermophila]QKV18886.1 hypothetical protein HTY61_10710 [Oricola thermophila]